jgi:hypothetical protein
MMNTEASSSFVSNSPTGNDEYDQQVRGDSEPSTRFVEERVNRPRNLLLAMMFVILATGFSAADIFLAPTAAGSANGSSCPNAYAYGFFNTAGNWGGATGKIGPGTTVHLCGGTYTFPGGNSEGLVFQGSGTATASITLQADAPAILTAPYWGNSSGPLIGVIDTNGNSYIVINGQNQLTLQATANGTNLANQVDWGNGVIAKGGSNVTVENLTISNIYVHACVLPVSNCTDENAQDSGGLSAYGTNLLVQNNTIHDAKLCVGGNYPGGVNYSNMQFLNNTTYNCDHGFEIGAGGNGSTISGLTVAGNNISTFQNWDDAANNNHHDGIHEFAYNSGDTVVGYYAYNNYIHGDFGNNFNAGLFTESASQTTNAYYFNNLIVDQSSVQHLGCGLICLENAGAGIYNNTITAPTGHSSVAINVYNANDVIENNVIYNIGEATGVNAPATYSNTTFNYNNYYEIGSSGWNQNDSFSGWQSSCGCDASSSNTNPNLSASFQPTSTSTTAIIDQGINLWSVGVTALDIDKAGVTRPSGTCTKLGATTCWSVGAYQFASGSIAPPPPTGLAAVVQ